MMITEEEKRKTKITDALRAIELSNPIGLAAAAGDESLPPEVRLAAAACLNHILAKQVMEKKLAENFAELMEEAKLGIQENVNIRFKP